MEESTATAAALGLDNAPKADEEFLAVLLKIFELSAAADAHNRRDRESAERVAYLSGKVEVLEKLLAGGP